MDVKKGTTTVVLVCKNGVVLAADTQASFGDAVASRTTRKIFQIEDRMAVTMAGSLGDAQNLVSLLKAEIALQKMVKPVTPKGVASLISRVLHSNRFFPYIVWLAVGGYDEKPSAFSIDAFGGLNDDVYIATRSGMQVAQGVLEDQFSEGLDLDRGVALAVRAIRSARERDLPTGGGIAVSVITPTGYKEFSEEEVQHELARP